MAGTGLADNLAEFASKEQVLTWVWMGRDKFIGLDR